MNVIARCVPEGLPDVADVLGAVDDPLARAWPRLGARRPRPALGNGCSTNSWGRKSEKRDLGFCHDRAVLEIADRHEPYGRRASMTFEIEGFTPAGVLGRGGFGTVYRAADDAHGREVAIKVLGRIDGDAARRRFDRERRAMGTVSGHPNIGVVYTSGFTATHEPYIVMEMIRGGSLADRLEREGPLPAADVIELGITLADALEHAHQGGVLHLDLKPENILMSRFGTPKIVDFGIAALVHEESSTSAIRATPAYADPDVLDGHHGTVRSDVYGLAATLFTLLSGGPPYSQGPSGLYQVMRRVALDPVPTVERDDVPRELARVLRRAMAKDPEDRPVSMAEFAAELRAVGTEPTGAPETEHVPNATCRSGRSGDPADLESAASRSESRAADHATAAA